MKIYDCFAYFNEKELLLLRYELLKDVVDKFIVVEANRTHTGEKRELLLLQEIRRMGLDINKFELYYVNLPDRKRQPNDWERERAQRNAIGDVLTSKEDTEFVAYIGDCDEIMDPAFVKYYAMMAWENQSNIIHVPMPFLMARADLQVYGTDGKPKIWTAGFWCTHIHLLHYTASEIRESHSRGLNSIHYEDGFLIDNGENKAAGWHFSWMGNTERMAKKYRAFMHYRDTIVGAAGNQKEIEDFIQMYVPGVGSTDPLGRKDHILRYYPVHLLPKKVFTIAEVKSFLLP